MQRLLSSTANNLVEQNIEFIEFWMQIDRRTSTDAVLNIDLGVISEDVIPNNILNTEDKNNNQAIDEGEDTGIDGRFLIMLNEHFMDQLKVILPWIIFCLKEIQSLFLIT